MITVLEFLERLLVGHNHKWHIIKEIEHRPSDGNVWFRFYCQCEVCGKIREF